MTSPSDMPALDDVRQEALLMQRVAAGDRDALAQIIRTHQQRVWAVAYRFTHHRPDADDIAQEAFLNLWKAAPRWEPAARLSTFLYRVVSNLCMDLHRRQSRRPAPLSAAAEPTTLDPAELESQETSRRVQQAIAALPQRQRMALILHRFEGQSYRQIAQSTGWGEAAIESLLSRAYASLRSQLSDLKTLT